jgi:tetratricopeptide (TPR) repeat protein
MSTVAASKGANSAEDQFVRALALTAQGFAGIKGPSGETAIDLLTGLAAGAGDVAVLAKAELLNARLVGKIVGGGDVPTVKDFEAVLQTADKSGVKPAVQFRTHLVRGLAALRDRNFDGARREMQTAQELADGSKDEVRLAEANFALGRLAVWQGRADLAEHYLGLAVVFWEGKGNKLLAAHARYELGVMHIDRREWAPAVETLTDVVAAYREAGAASGYLDRAQEMLGAALVGAGNFDRAREVLEPLRDTKDDYRYAMVHRNLGRMHLKLAQSTSGEESDRHFDLARQEHQAGYDRISGWPAVDFPRLTMRQLEGELLMHDPGKQSSLSLMLAGDMLARVAEAFGSRTNERPHEINARISALEAYLAALDARDVNEGEVKSLKAAARTEADRLRSAAASIAFRLNDEVFALIAKADQLSSQSDAGAAPADAAPAAEQEPLPVFMRRNLPEPERLEVLARLAEALGRIHDAGSRPCGFGPSDVVVRQPHIPVIQDFAGPEALRAFARAADRPFAAPEILRGDKGDARSDLYVVGALLVAWFGKRPPANEGRPWLWLIRGLRGRPLKRRKQPLLTGLALELTALNPDNRPATAYETADRLRQAALALSRQAAGGKPS